MFNFEEEKNILLLREQVKILYSGIPNSLLATLSGACIAFYIFIGDVSIERLLVWIIFLLVVILLRFINYRYFKIASLDPPEKAFTWYLQFMLGTGFMALAVGSSGYLLFVFDNVSLQVTLALMITCIASFATTTISPRAEIAIPFQIIIFAPLLVSLYMRQTTETEYMFWMLLTLLILLCISGYRIYVTITRSIELTLEAEQREDELRKSQQRLTLFIKDTPMAVIEWDFNSEVVAWNPAAENMFLYKEQEALGKKGRDLIIPEVVMDTAEDIWHALITNTGGYHFIEQTRRKDGGMLICEWFNTPLINNDGRVIGAVSLIKDITMEMENERLKREFVSIISHELRTPVTSIKGSLGLLASGVLSDNPEKTREMLDIAQKNTDRLQLLVNDILDVEKIDSGKIEYHFKKADLSKMVPDIIQALDSYAEKYKINVIAGVIPDEVIVKMDPDRIFQVITNMLSNAIKFSEENGTVSLAIHVLKKNKFRIMVSNRGDIIPISEKKKLFGKFYQSDSSDNRAKEGSGLGLYICQKILEQHNTSLDFNSSEDDGTTFFFDLDAAGKPSASENAEALIQQ